jgi:hypothetical protein
MSVSTSSDVTHPNRNKEEIYLIGAIGIVIRFEEIYFRDILNL